MYATKIDLDDFKKAAQKANLTNRDISVKLKLPIGEVTDMLTRGTQKVTRADLLSFAGKLNIELKFTVKF